MFSHLACHIHHRNSGVLAYPLRRAVWAVSNCTITIPSDPRFQQLFMMTPAWQTCSSYSIRTFGGRYPGSGWSASYFRSLMMLQDQPSPRHLDRRPPEQLWQLWQRRRSGQMRRKQKFLHSWRAGPWWPSPRSQFPPCSMFAASEWQKYPSLEMYRQFLFFVATMSPRLPHPQSDFNMSPFKLGPSMMRPKISDLQWLPSGISSWQVQKPYVAKLPTLIG